TLSHCASGNICPLTGAFSVKNDLWPSLDEVYAHMRAAEKSGYCKVKSIGKSVEGRDILVAIVSDHTIDEDKKEISLFLACEHGDEKTGATTMLQMIDWLVGAEPAAAAARKSQAIYIIPVVNPDGYV